MRTQGKGETGTCSLSRICSGKGRSLWILLVIVATCLVFSGCTSKQEKVTNFIKRGDALMAEGDPTRAILEYKNALQIDPKNPAAMVALGKAYLEKKEYRKAYGMFRSAVEVNPSFDRARIEMASLLSMSRAGKQALEELDKVKEPSRFEPRLSLVKARALISLNRYEDAIKIIDSLHGMDKNKEAQIYLSICYENTGDKVRMADAIERWRKIAPKDPGSYTFMVRYYLKHGDRKRASNELDAMVKADPGNTRLQLFRAEALERMGLLEEAKKAYAALPRQPEMMKAQAAFWMRHKDYERARDILDHIVEKDPSDVQGIILLSKVYAIQGDYRKAMSVLEKAQKKGLSNEDAQKLTLAKGKLYLLQGRIDKAEEACKEVLKQNQGNMDAHLMLGRIFFTKGDMEKAEIHLNQVGVARPRDAGVHILLARCQFLNKKESMAIDTLKKAIAVNPSNTRLRLELVRYYLKDKDYDQALKVIDKGLALKSGDLLLLKAKGEIEAADKRYKDASNTFLTLIKSFPNKNLGYMEMGRLMLVQGKFDDAAKWFMKAYNTPRGWQVALPALIRTYAMAGRLDRALKVAEEEVKKRKDSPLARFYLGKVLMVKGDLKRAEQVLLEASKQAPQWAEPYKALALIYLKEKKIKEAIGRVEDLYKREPTVPVGINLAALYEYAGKYDKAVNIYEDLVKRHERSPFLLNNLAYMYAEHFTDRGPLSRAKEMITRALAIKPDDPNLMDTAGWVAYKLGNLKMAWGYLEDALAKDPQNPFCQLHSAIVAYDMGNKDVAREHLEKVMHIKLDPRARKQALELKKKWGM